MTIKEKSPNTKLIPPNHNTKDNFSIDPKTIYGEPLKQAITVTNKLEPLDPKNFNPETILLEFTETKPHYTDFLRRIKDTIRKRRNLQITDESYLRSLDQAKKSLFDKNAPPEKLRLVIATFLDTYNKWPEDDLINRGKLLYQIISIAEETGKKLEELEADQLDTIETNFKDDLINIENRIKELRPLSEILLEYIDKIPLSNIRMCMDHYIKSVKQKGPAQYLPLANTAARRLEQEREKEEAKEILESIADPLIINMRKKPCHLTKFIFEETLPLETFKWTIEALAEEENNPVLDKVIEFFANIIGKATRNFLAKINKEEARQIINGQTIDKTKLNLTQQETLHKIANIHTIIADYYPVKHYFDSSPLLQNLIEGDDLL